MSFVLDMNGTFKVLALLVLAAGVAYFRWADSSTESNVPNERRGRMTVVYHEPSTNSTVNNHAANR